MKREPKLNIVITASNEFLISHGIKKGEEHPFFKQERKNNPGEFDIYIDPESSANSVLIRPNEYTFVKKPHLAGQRRKADGI